MNKKHPGVYLRGKVYWIEYSRNGRPFRESSHSEKESDAVRLLNLRRGDIARGVPVTPKLGRVTIDELVEDMKNELLANGRSTRNSSGDGESIYSQSSAGNGHQRLQPQT